MCEIREREDGKEGNSKVSQAHEKKNTEGKVLRVCNIYEEIKRIRRHVKGLKEIKDTFHDTPSLWNISSSVLKATGLTRLSYNEISSGWTRKKNRRVAHYPSTPASNALLLSSRDDIPVRAKIRVR